LQVQIIAASVDLTLSILVPAGRFSGMVSRVVHSLTYTTTEMASEDVTMEIDEKAKARTDDMHERLEQGKVRCRRFSSGARGGEAAARPPEED